MDFYIKNTNKLRIRQVGYVFFWSLGLFAATFYCLFDQNEEMRTVVFGKMATIKAVDLAKMYLFPLFMAMSLFLLDVRHEISSHGQQFTHAFLKRFISCFLVFAFAIAFSILFNTSFWGWFFFPFILVGIIRIETVYNYGSRNHRNKN